MLSLRLPFVFLLSTYVASEAFRSDFQGHGTGKCLDGHEVERDPTIQATLRQGVDREANS